MGHITPGGHWGHYYTCTLFCSDHCLSLEDMVRAWPSNRLWVIWVEMIRCQCSSASNHHQVDFSLCWYILTAHYVAESIDLNIAESIDLGLLRPEQNGCYIADSLWLGAARQQAIAWTNADQVLRCHIISLTSLALGQSCDCLSASEVILRISGSIHHIDSLSPINSLPPSASVNQVSIGSDIGLSPIRCQAII